MADALLSFGVEKLWDLIVRESERFQGVEEQFNGLKSDVGMLKCFLEDADAKKHTSAVVRNTIKDINEIVLDAQDIIETFLRKEELGKKGGIKRSVRRLSCVISESRGLSFEMEAISTRIDKVIRHMKTLGVQQVTVNEGYTQTIEKRQRRMRQTFSSDNEDHLVGLEEKVNQLTGYLTEENSRIQVVSITGMGGIGKTTLARQVFNHETIKNHFQGLAWVCVSQEFTREHVWRTILQKLRPESEVLKMMEEQVQEKLFQVLETQKALIVFDDIWREEDWDMIKPVFPRGKGWKILLTSRNEGVALRADPKCFIFKPDCLTDEESWTLFGRIAFPNTTENEVDEEMEEIGKKMIEHCGGLPLAVKVLGGLLAAQYTLSEWKKVHENIKPQIVGGTSFNGRNISSVYHILYLSYEELPIYLKHCFLYFAHFPEDYQIHVEKLSYYWAAEDVRRSRYYDGASIRDIADEYIDELVKRNMVIFERDITTSKYETCQLHDMMREVCVLKAEEENFVQIVDTRQRQLQALTSTANSQLSCKSRRLVIQSRDHTVRIENPKLRSLLNLEYRSSLASDLSFTRLQLMRVLDLSWVKFEGGKLPSSIGKLIHLRYLCLFGANVTRIPSSMRNLKQLIYLNLDVYYLYMPNFLKEMREMRYLHLPKRLDDKVKLELGNLVKLETLKNFSTEHGSVKDLHGMTRLETLSILSSGGYSVEKLSSSLSQLKHLEDLTITDKRHWNTSTEEFVLDCVHLRHLTLRIYMPRLPDEQHLPSRLTTLSLENCRLEEDPMPILEKLLHLKEVYLLEKAFCGKRMVFSRGGFLQLQKLKFEALVEWEEWIVEEGSMPLLHNLDISECDKLKEFPDGLRFVTSLKDVSVHLRGEEWKNRLSEGFLPSRLTTLSLYWCRLEEDPMPILEKLLHLKDVYLGKRSFCGRRMVCSTSGFRHLKKLKLWELDELEEWIVKEGSMPLLQSLSIGGCVKLEEWIVEEGSMPLLHMLYIGFCKKLKELPDGLQFITSLEILKLLCMGKEWKKRVSEGGKDYYKVQHASVDCDGIDMSDEQWFTWLGER